MGACFSALASTEDRAVPETTKATLATSNTTVLTNNQRSDAFDPTESLHSEEPLMNDMHASGQGLNHGKSLSSLPKVDEFESSQAIRFDTYELKAPMREEVGVIQFEYIDKQEGLDFAKEIGSPLLLIEAEKSGDMDAARGVFSHPLIAEAAESLFVTVCPEIEQKKASERYRPSPNRKPWYTKISILDVDGKDLVEPFGGDLLIASYVSERLMDALKASGKNVPKYLELLHREENARLQISTSGVERRFTRKVYLGVSDWALAEAELPELDEVLATRCARIEQQHVVEVVFYKIPLTSLLRFAALRGFVDTIYYSSQDERVAATMECSKLGSQPAILKLESPDLVRYTHDSKKALRSTEMRYVPMTDLQACLINRLISQGSFHKATHLLSKRQGQMLMETYSKSSKLSLEAVDKPIETAWRSFQGLGAVSSS